MSHDDCCDHRSGRDHSGASCQCRGGGANRVPKQELESVTKREPKLHFAISAELKSGADGKNVVDGYKLIVMNYGDAPSVVSRHLAAQTIGADHPIFSQVWNGHGQFVEAMCNSIVVMPGG